MLLLLNRFFPRTIYSPVVNVALRRVFAEQVGELEHAEAVDDSGDDGDSAGSSTSAATSKRRKSKKRKAAPRKVK